MLAFSIPSQGRILVLSYEGLHTISLFPNVTVATDEAYAEDYDIYDTEQNTLWYGGQLHRALGLYGGDPILEDGDGHYLNLEPEHELLRIIDMTNHVIQEIKYFDLSGDWAFATFSTDGKVLAIGVPSDLFIFYRD
jgi:hypothetical protein